ncbi:J domain-containing protein [Natronorubrum sp. FCH18a]|uniref:J domain-containing protein n=1 Tax=Natronorubrum sp. FCH18a TaxID=3447018 RepID=UPI003F51711F
MGQTYYDVLEVDPDATRAEVQTAYRERVLETHPDHNDALDAAEQFKRVSTARSVLTDGTERARYDRLGHDAYLRLADRSTSSSGPASSDSSTADGGDDGDGTAGQATRSRTETGTSNQSGSTASRGSTDGTATGHDRRGNGSRTRTSSGRTHSRAESSYRNRSEGRDDRTGSHHARQRARRQRKTARQRAGGGWTFVTEGGRSSDGSSSSNTASSSSDASSSATGTAGATGTTTATGTTSATGTGSASAAAASRASSTPDEGAASGFRYAVHGWEGEVDLEWEGQAMTQTTAVTIGCLWLLYPMFVAASLTSLFPLVVNAIVAACTLAFVGYLLTRPRVATAVFGFWSVLFPLGIDRLSAVPPFSITGLLALGFAWVPFGYAVALWWALRP